MEQVNQSSAINQTEDLQDFRREREGTLILKDGRPLLILAFGIKYFGPNSAKYKIEGKYLIPVNFKSIAKWEDDEICFMTRQGVSGPEYQIIFLPKSSVADDFTVFEWTENIASLWDSLLSLLETQDKDMSMFARGPFHVFGLTDDAVQTAAEKSAGNAEETGVEGVLYCKDGVAPTLDEFQRYLGFIPGTDEAYAWIPVEFMQEQLPINWYQYVSSNMVYWVDATTQLSSWKHPLYDKYRKMLLMARLQRPLPHWKAVLAFQIEFLFLNNINNMKIDGSGFLHTSAELNAIFDLARVFKINLTEEPYLVHVLKRALRHYGTVTAAKRAVTDVEDFKALAQRYREVVKTYEANKLKEELQTASLKKCVECDQNATVYCDNCTDLLCLKCFARLHSKGRRKNHKRTFVELGTCTECELALAGVQCLQCGDAFCVPCFGTVHARGGRRNHVPVVLRVFDVEKNKVPVTSVFAFGGISPAAVTVGKSSSHQLRRALSPWVRLNDPQTALALYVNLSTRDERRDLPLEAVNEPLEGELGGGVASGWADAVTGH